MEKIPKIIHYCWFGGNPLSDLAKNCIESWHSNCVDYKIIRWDENNFDINCNQYVKEAYESQKWAFVTDYVRLYALYQYGGVYMDTDVELLRNIDVFLQHSAFSGFEDDRRIPTAIMGSVRRHSWVEYLLSYYDKRYFILENNTLDTTTNVEIITAMTKKRYNINLNNTYQELEDGITIYPKDYFCPKSYESGLVNLTENTVCIHHFNGSWLTGEDRAMHKKGVFLKKVFGKRLGRILANINKSINEDGYIKTAHKALKKIF